MYRMLCVLFVVLPFFAFSHPGGTDAIGGHTDRSSGKYHCHSQNCFNAQEQTNQATLEAIESDRPMSFIYRRDDWKHWIDQDNDCISTRDEMLLEQARHSVEMSPDGCYVSKGVWVDPFSGKTFTRPSELHVDHIVPLKWANDHGGDSWSAQKKEIFANDPLNLLVVHDRLNQQKGAKGPSQWMPPNHFFRCNYLRKWKTVLSKYTDLRMTAKEKRIYTKQLEACTN